MLTRGGVVRDVFSGEVLLLLSGCCDARHEGDGGASMVFAFLVWLA